VASCACEVGASQPAQRKKKRISSPRRLASNQLKVTFLSLSLFPPGYLVSIASHVLPSSLLPLRNMGLGRAEIAREFPF
jgi:hypothetical protein